jgi:hypothetical protein
MGIGDPLRNAQIILETLWAKLSVVKTSWKCPNKSRDLFGTFLAVPPDDVLIGGLKGH